MMETYDNPVTQSPFTTITNATNKSLSYAVSLIHPDNISTAALTTTTIDSSGVFGNASLLPWEVVADTFLKQLNGLESAENNGNGSSSRNGSGLSGSGVSIVQQLPFAAYQSVAAISTQSTGTDEQFHDEGGGGGVGGTGAGPDSFVSWASTATPSQVFFIVKVVIMCFIIVSAVFGNLLVIVSVMRHRKLR